MKSTVIIPNYNGMKYLEGCIKALEQQKDTRFQILVVDNGSTDESLSWLRKNCPRAKIIALHKNTGFCHAVNVGIQQASTPYVILLNNDTRVMPDFVRALERAMERQEGIFSVSAKMLDMKDPALIDGAGDLYCALGWAFARGKGKRADRYGTKREEIFSACAGAAIYKREIFDKIGLFDENHFAYLEDCDIGYRARLYGYRNYYEPKAVVHHAGSGVTGSRHNEFKVLLSAKNSVYLIYKNMPFLQIIINLPFLAPGFLLKYLFFRIKGLGKAYTKGWLQGVRLSCSKEGRGHKVRLGIRGLPSYMRVQWQLWINTLKRFIEI